MSSNETIEQIEAMLDAAGVDLEFDLGIIKGIPGFEILTLYNEAGTQYDVKKQLFQFQISVKDTLEYEIKIDDTFSYTDGYYIYNFQIDTTPMLDTIGWTSFSANLLSKEEA